MSASTVGRMFHRRALVFLVPTMCRAYEFRMKCNCVCMYCNAAAAATLPDSDRLYQVRCSSLVSCRNRQKFLFLSLQAI